MSSRSEQIIRRKLSDEVFDRLKGLITSRKLGRGDAMPSERELMKRFGVGRPAIREAMQALSNMGLLTISHGERAKVRQLTARTLFHQVDLAAQIMLSTSPDSLEQLKEARRFFERGMVQEAALKANKEDIVRLLATLDQHRQHLGRRDDFIRYDMHFHTQIAAISRNPIFEAVSKAILSWLQEYHTELLLWTGQESMTLAEHEEIIQRIAEHDQNGAEQAMMKHLNRSSVLYAHQPSSR